MATEVAAAPKDWQGRFYEDFDVGDVFRSRFGRTVTEYDNILFTALTHNTNSIHFDKAHAERTQFGQILVNSAFTLALITGMTVPDTSENAAANLAWSDITQSNPDVGIVTMRCRGINQRRKVVVEYRRTFMVYKRTASQAERSFPGTDEEWRV